MIWCNMAVAQKLPCSFHLHGTDSVRLFEENLQRFSSKKPTFERSEFTVTVVVHVVWSTAAENISDAQIVAQIKALNRDFYDDNQNLLQIPTEFRDLAAVPRIRFCLATTDTNGKATTGIVRKQTNLKNIGLQEALFSNDTGGGSAAWQPDRFLNIWVANTGNLVSGLGSYPAQVPFHKMGVIVHPKFFNGQLGRTLTHEVGHFLGLKHLWGEGNNCQTDDDVLDTPPQRKSYADCPTYPKNGCSSSEMFMNYMDYVDDPCMHLFTKGQCERMIATLKTYRKGLVENPPKCFHSLQAYIFNINIFPNPSNGIYTIRFQTPVIDLISYKIFSSLGELVESQTQLIYQDLQVDLSHQINGTYILQINNSNKEKVFSAKIEKIN